MKKIKQFLNVTIKGERAKDILTVVIVIMVGLGSFVLGRMSKDGPTIGLRIQTPGQSKVEAAGTGLVANSTNKAPVATNPEGKSFFASNRGTKYYPIDCSSGQTIKKENRIYFATKEEAERAGYELSSSCN